jgi:RNA polymerase primary sigma factor
MQTDEHEDPVAMYRRELTYIEPMTSDEQAELFRQLGGSGKWNDDQENVARRIIESQLQKVVNIAEEYSSSGVQMLDLIQEGNLGLFKAVEQFARQNTGDFPAYAAGLIRDSITAFVKNSR